MTFLNVARVNLRGDVALVNLRGGVNFGQAVVVMTDKEHMPKMELPEGKQLLCYEEFLAKVDAPYTLHPIDPSFRALSRRLRFTF